MKTALFQTCRHPGPGGLRHEAGSIRRSPFFILGPCVIQSKDLLRQIAARLCEIRSELNIHIVFKASFDKANRTSLNSFRGIGLHRGLQALAAIREEFELPVLTDVHESHQVKLVAEHVDVLQIPAFLCRQTDLLLAAGESGLAVNIKKGQYMSGAAMAHSVEKVRSTGNDQVFLTERGSFFGYGDLVVDFRNLEWMREFAPVIFDATHSVQTPPTSSSQTSGSNRFVPLLARAAAAVGVDGFFLETHPDPSKSPSDGANMVELGDLKDLLSSILAINQTIPSSAPTRMNHQRSLGPILDQGIS